MKWDSILIYKNENLIGYGGNDMTAFINVYMIAHA
jgi:hypothetical protein